MKNLQPRNNACNGLLPRNLIPWGHINRFYRIYGHIDPARFDLPCVAAKPFVYSQAFLQLAGSACDFRHCSHVPGMEEGPRTQGIFPRRALPPIKQPPMPATHHFLYCLLCPPAAGAGQQSRHVPLPLPRYTPAASSCAAATTAPRQAIVIPRGERGKMGWGRAHPKRNPR